MHPENKQIHNAYVRLWKKRRRVNRSAQQESKEK